MNDPAMSWHSVMPACSLCKSCKMTLTSCGMKVLVPFRSRLLSGVRSSPLFPVFVGNSGHLPACGRSYTVCEPVECRQH